MLEFLVCLIFDKFLLDDLALLQAPKSVLELLLADHDLAESQVAVGHLNRSPADRPRVHLKSFLNHFFCLV